MVMACLWKDLVLRFRHYLSVAMVVIAVEDVAKRPKYCHPSVIGIIF
jgi:hypothetical protein